MLAFTSFLFLINRQANLRTPDWDESLRNSRELRPAAISTSIHIQVLSVRGWRIIQGGRYKERVRGPGIESGDTEVGLGALEMDQSSRLKNRRKVQPRSSFSSAYRHRRRDKVRIVQ